MAVKIGSDTQREVNVRSNCYGAICNVISKDYMAPLGYVVAQLVEPLHFKSEGSIPDRVIGILH
jgi:hypothetical protein